MAPGTWAQLVVQNQDTCLSDNGNTGSMLPFCNSMPWNSVTKQIDILGQDHNGGGMKYVQYDEASNQFFVALDPTNFSGGHGYDHVAVNPTTGHLYYRQYGGGTSPVSVYRKNVGSATFTQLPTIRAADVAYMGVAQGTCWWSGSFTGGGAQGSLMVYVAGECSNTALRGAICAYNPLTNSWFYNQSARSPNGAGPGSAYHGIIEYSATKNVAVYGGGNGQDTRLWRMDSSGAVVELANLPSGKRVGAGTGQGKITADPVTGNFLLLSAGQLWELNPDGAGIWTQKAAPPAQVANPSNLDASGIVIAVALPDHGVVAYISQRGSSGGTFFLYRNA